MLMVNAEIKVSSVLQNDKYPTVSNIPYEIDNWNKQRYHCHTPTP